MRLAFATQPLHDGWRMARTPPDAARTPSDLQNPTWIPARIPGTAWQALLDAGADPDRPASLHDEDIWFQTDLEGQGPGLLHCEALAGLAELWLDDQPLAASNTMFAPCHAQLTLSGRHTLTIRFRALTRALAAVRGRQRWRTRLTDAPGLRRHRQTLLGHMPGWCPPIAAIGPHRPIHLHDPAHPIADLHLRATLQGTEPHLRVVLNPVAGIGPDTPIAITIAGRTTQIPSTGDASRTAEIALPGLAAWWPHTHGDPALHDATLTIDGADLPLPRIGFRRLHIDHGPGGRSFALQVNDVPIFCRGACWTNASLADLAGTDAAYRPALTRARDANMNMIRIPGIMTYEAPAFHHLCNELGLLVWQEFMFANLDVPDGDPNLAPLIAAEAQALLDTIGASPSLAILCGGSEVAQQATFMGLPPEARPLPLFEQTLADLAATHAPGIPYVPNTPWGGEPPTRNDTAIAHYYGVGAYLRPLEDARRAQVRFASECLAFANIPEEQPHRPLPPAVHHPDWKRAVPRDPGAPWDFEDVRDHYLALLYDADPPRLRTTDPERYLALSRATSADLMEYTLAEWRRPASTTAGALVWQLQDLRYGAGWGVLDDRARPKPACHGFARASAPIQVLLTDEGLDGLAIHVLNERPAPLEADLTLTCLRHGHIPVAEGTIPIHLAARSAMTLTCQDVLGRFFDTTRAHRFGPPTHEINHARLTQAGALLSEAFHFPEGRNLPPADLGLTVTPDGNAILIGTARFAQSVHIVCDEGEAHPNWFHLAPGPPRRVTATTGEVRALNALSPTTFRT